MGFFNIFKDSELERLYKARHGHYTDRVNLYTNQWDKMVAYPVNHPVRRAFYETDNFLRLEVLDFTQMIADYEGSSDRERSKLNKKYNIPFHEQYKKSPTFRKMCDYDVEFWNKNRYQLDLKFSHLARIVANGYATVMKERIKDSCKSQLSLLEDNLQKVRYGYLPYEVDCIRQSGYRNKVIERLDYELIKSHIMSTRDLQTRFHLCKAYSRMISWLLSECKQILTNENNQIRKKIIWSDIIHNGITIDRTDLKSSPFKLTIGDWKRVFANLEINKVEIV